MTGSNPRNKKLAPKTSYGKLAPKTSYGTRKGKPTLSDPIQDKMIKERVKLKAPKKAMKKGGRA